MSRRAFNLAEFAHGLLADLGIIKSSMIQIERTLYDMSIKLQVAATMAPKSKKEGKTNGDGNNE